MNLTNLEHVLEELRLELNNHIRELTVTIYNLRISLKAEEERNNALQKDANCLRQDLKEVSDSSVTAPLHQCFIPGIISLAACDFCYKTSVLSPSFLILYVYVQPISEKGDYSNPSSYCLTALTSTVSRDFESHLSSHLLKHLGSPSFLSDHECGFHKIGSIGDDLSSTTSVAVLSERSLESCYSP